MGVVRSKVTAEVPVEEPIKKRARAVPKGPTASIQFSGDATKVMLEADGRRYRASGAVPTGTYRILAWFPGTPDPVDAGEVTAKANQRITLQCASLMRRCSPALELADPTDEAP